MRNRQLCEMCGRAVGEPIVVHIRRRDGAAEEYVVCSIGCDHRLWEREQGRFIGYVVEVRSYMGYIDIPLEDTQWGNSP
jgi:hypothetical protein